MMIQWRSVDKRCTYTKWVESYHGGKGTTDDSQSFSSFAILDAMFLNPIDVPEIRLNRTPFNESLGSLQTSISHWTKESVFGSPWTQRRRNFSRCSKSQLFLSKTFLISCIISLGSRDDVVFMLHVNLNDRGFTVSSFDVSDRSASFLTFRFSPTRSLLSPSASGKVTTLLLNLDESLLKNDGLCWCDTEDVSWVCKGTPPGPLRSGLRSRVWPLWKVLRLAEPLGKALFPGALDRGDRPGFDELTGRSVKAVLSVVEFLFSE